MSVVNQNEHPLVTFALFAYNQEDYIRRAVEGAFSQTYRPLEIILSDDCSSDRTFEIIREMEASYEGPHYLSVRKNAFNLGLAGHVNKVLELSRGEIILIAAGDDISLPTRSTASVELFRRHPSATAVMFSADVIDSNGQCVGQRLVCNDNLNEKRQKIEDFLWWRHKTLGATRAIKREVFLKFGDLRPDCPTEDTPLLLRSLLLGDNILSSCKAIKYRRHDRNLSGVKSLKTMNIDAIYWQYSDDIIKGEDLGAIRPSLTKRLQDWIPEDRKAREIKLKMSEGQKLTVAEILFVVRHPSFGYREMVKMAFMVFRLFREPVL